MQLTKEQLSEIENSLKTYGVKYYDVRIELVDHFANILEQRFAENSALDFTKEIKNIYNNFNDTNFKKLLKEKTKSVTNRFYKQSLRHLKSFFKTPKILITVVVFSLLVLLMNTINDKASFFSVLGFVLIFLGFRLLFNVNMRDTKKETFLILNTNMYFFNVFYLFVMLFNFFTRNRIDESFFNTTYNYIELCVFMLLIIFYWSGEFVYYQNKKLVKEQYPNIAV